MQRQKETKRFGARHTASPDLRFAGRTKLYETVIFFQRRNYVGLMCNQKMAITLTHLPADLDLELDDDQI